MTNMTIHKLKEIKREPIDEELGEFDQEKWDASNDTNTQMMQISNMLQEDGLVQKNDIGTDNETSEKVPYNLTYFCFI